MTFWDRPRLARMTPRVGTDGEAVVPVFPNGRDPRFLGWLVIAFALVPVLLVIADDRLGFRLVMGALALALVIAGIGVRIMLGAIEPRIVRVDGDAPALHFRPPASATAPMLLLPVAFLLPAIAQLVVDLASLPTMSSSLIVGRGPYALGVLAIVVIAAQLWGMRVPAGLILTTEGLLGIRGAGPVQLRWEELASVSVVAGPAAKLSLIAQGGGRPILAPSRVLGSDPNQVAAIVRFYLERPAERRVLAEGGVVAVRRVEEALRKTTR